MPVVTGFASPEGPVRDDVQALHSAADPKAISESEARYRAALQAGRMGSWETDFRTGIRTWTPEGIALFQLALDGLHGHVGGDRDEWVAAVHPDDRDVLSAIVAQAQLHDSFQAEYRILRPGGETAWLSGRGQVVERDEAGTPVRLVNVMADVSEKKRAELALREREAELRSIFENVAVGMARQTLDGHWLSVNQRLADLLGYEREELLRMHPLDLALPEDKLLERGEIADLLAGRVEHCAFDIRYLNRDGGSIWLGRTISLVRGEDGAPQHLISVYRDVSERRRAQEHQHFLMGELAHRSKNLLAVIQALASQTIRGSRSLDDFRTRFLQRLKGVAASQDILLNQTWHGGDLKALVMGQLAMFSELDSGRVGTSGPDIFLRADAVQAIGLALHELATNALKYGALSSSQGRIDISWSRIESGDDIGLVWRERDGPRVSAPTHRGFGHVVMERMVADAINGRVAVGYEPDGLVWRLDIPADRIVAVKA